MKRGRLKKSLKKIGQKLWLNIKKIKHVSFTVSHTTLITSTLIVLIMIIAFTIRMLPIRWGFYLSEFDPYFQYRLAKYIEEHGFLSWVNWHDTKSWYPYGRDVGKTSFPGLALTAAAIHMVLRALGVPITLYDFCVIFPPIMGALTCLMMYFLGKEIGGKDVGLLSALLMALNPSYISRTSLGFFDDETVGIFAMVVVFTCFLKAITSEKSLEKRLVYSIVAGLTLGYVCMSWGAARYPIAMLALSALVIMAFRKYTPALLQAYAITLGLGLFIATQVPKLGLKFLMEATCIAVLGVLILMCIYELVRHIEAIKIRVVVTTVILGILVAGTILLVKYGIIMMPGGKFMSVINPLTRLKNPLIQSVAEHRPLAWGPLFYENGVGLLFMIFGVYFTARNPTDKNLFLMVYGLTALYFAGSMVRLTLLLAAPLCLLWALGLSRLARPFVTIMKEASLPRRKLRPFVGKEFSIAFLILLLALSFLSVTYSVEAASTPVTIAAASVPRKEHFSDWLEALAWMRENLPDDAVVCSWWDYGYWITVMANKTTLADNGTINSTQIKQIALMYLSNETQAIEILKKYNVTHVVIFITFAWHEYHFVEIGWGDEGKWRWMAKIAGLNETDYWNPRTKEWTLLGKETVIYKLMTYGWRSRLDLPPLVDLEHFKLVFHSHGEDKGGVYALVCVYEVVYEREGEIS